MTVHGQSRRTGRRQSLRVEEGHLSPLELENAANLALEYMPDAEIPMRRARPLDHRHVSKAENVDARTTLLVLEKELSSIGVIQTLANRGWSNPEMADRITALFDNTNDERLKVRLIKVVAMMIQQAEGQNIHIDHSLKNANIVEIRQKEAELHAATGMSADEILKRAEQRGLNPGDGELRPSDKGGEGTTGE